MLENLGSCVKEIGMGLKVITGSFEGVLTGTGRGATAFGKDKARDFKKSELSIASMSGSRRCRY